MTSLYFYVILFSFSAVMLLRSLLYQRWNDLPVYFILLAFSFIAIGAAIATNVIIPRGIFVDVFGGLP
jgi:hypothetical protein